MTDRAPSDPIETASGDGDLSIPNPYVQMTALPSTGVITSESPNPYVTRTTTVMATTVLPSLTTVLPSSPTAAVDEVSSTIADAAVAEVLVPELVEPDPVLAALAAEPLAADPIAAEPPAPQPLAAPVAPQTAPQPSPQPAPPAAPQPAPPVASASAAPPVPPVRQPLPPEMRERRRAVETARRQRQTPSTTAARNQAGDAAAFLAISAAAVGLWTGGRGIGSLAVVAAVIALIIGLAALAKKGLRKGSAGVAILVAIAVLLFSLGGLAAGSSTPSSESTTHADDGPATEVPGSRDDDTDEGVGAGSRTSPYPVGEEFRLDSWDDSKWRIAVEPATFDAGDLILDINEYNPVAPDGYQYVLVPVRYTYLGGTDTDGVEKPTGDPWLDVFVEMSTPDDKLFNDSYLYVYPDHVRRAEHLAVGESGLFTVAFLVPSDTTDTATLRFETREAALYAAIG